MKKYLIIILLCFALPVLAQDNEKLRVAIFDPSTSGSGVDHTTAVAVRELISSTVVNSGKYEIVERSLLDKIMQEQQFSQSGAVDESQITEIGKLAGANKVVVSVISAVGERNMISIKLIDVQTASIELQKAKMVNNNELLDCIGELTEEVFDISQAQANKNAKAQNAALEGEFVPSPERLIRTLGLNEGGVRELVHQSSIYVRCDFTAARVNGMDLIKFGSTGKARVSEQYKNLPFGDAMRALERDICRTFCESANINTKYFKYQNVQSTSAYTLTIYLVKADKSGRNNICDYVFTDSVTGRVIAIITRESKGGGFGTFTSLLTNAIKKDSEDFVKTMNKMLKKARKR